jgi:hypothetical protein
MKKSISKTVTGLVAAVALGFGAAAMAAAPKYKMEVVKGDGAMAPPALIYAINDQGTMAGYISGMPRRFDKTLTRYTSPRSAAEVLTDSVNMDAQDINADGDVLGYGNPPAIWRIDGGREAVPLTTVSAFNNHGWVAGSLNSDAVVWHDGVFTPLESVEANWATVSAINDLGNSAGSVAFQVGDEHHSDLAIWDAAGALKRVSIPGTKTASGSAINESGHVAGYASTNTGYLAIFYDGATVTRLPTVNGIAVSNVVAMNDQDEVLGDHGPFDGPVLWRNGKGYLLRDLLEDHGKDWLYLKGYAINNSGTIVGWGNYKGNDRGFIAKRKTP